jgi:hypothetical protein
VRQHDVQNDEVVAAFGRQPHPVGAVEGDLDREALTLEAALHHRRDLLVVLDQQQLHRGLRQRASDSQPCTVSLNGS